MVQHIIIHGNPIDGLTIVGPFEDAEDAANWAERVCGGDWWLAELQDPNEQEHNS